MTQNERTEQAALADWATCPQTFAAYYTFPAEQLPFFGRPRPYREQFRPCLHTYVNQTGSNDLGLAHQAIITTWLGATLGRIVSARVYRHNFGGRMVSMRVQGTNGVEYVGRASWDNGSCINLRQVKGVRS